MCKFSDIVALQEKQVRDPLRMYPGPYPTLQKVLLTEEESTQNRGETMAPMGHAGEGAGSLRTGSFIATFGGSDHQRPAGPQNPDQCRDMSPIFVAHQQRQELQAAQWKLLIELNQRLEPILRVLPEETSVKPPTEGRGLAGAMRSANADLDASCVFLNSILTRLEL